MISTVTLLLPLIQEGMAWCVHEVLIYCTGKSVVKLTDRLDMTIVVN